MSAALVAVAAACLLPGSARCAASPPAEPHGVRLVFLRPPRGFAVPEGTVTAERATAFVKQAADPEMVDAATGLPDPGQGRPADLVLTDTKGYVAGFRVVDGVPRPVPAAVVTSSSYHASSGRFRIHRERLVGAHGGFDERAVTGGIVQVPRVAAFEFEGAVPALGEAFVAWCDGQAVVVFAR